MKINVLQNLSDFKGQPIETAAQTCSQCGQPVGKRESLTLRVVCVNALLFVQPNQQLSGADKMKRNDLAQRIWTEDKVELTVQELADVQRFINETYASPLVVAQSWRMLESVEE